MMSRNQREGEYVGKHWGRHERGHRTWRTSLSHGGWAPKLTPAQILEDIKAGMELFHRMALTDAINHYVSMTELSK